MSSGLESNLHGRIAGVLRLSNRHGLIEPRPTFTHVVVAPLIEDELYMRTALTEARKGLGWTSPNPAVGAILVTGGKVVAAGHHRLAGSAHAEVSCLEKVSAAAISPESTLYVTLEPCSTAGRTPPCTDKIIATGIKRVVVGTIDPNPRHAGRGIRVLEQAGIRVTVGVLGDECEAVNEAFNKWIQTTLPFVIAKCGMTLDGRITMPPGESRLITSSASRRHANRIRASVDAILVGAETIRADDPRLTVRTMPRARQPWRVVLTRSGNVPPPAHILTDRFKDRTLIFRDRKLRDVLAELGRREVTSVLIDGGGNVLGQALDERLIDRVHVYLAPVLSGGITAAFRGHGAATTNDGMRLRDIRFERIGDDIWIDGRASYPGPEPKAAAQFDDDRRVQSATTKGEKC